MWLGEQQKGMELGQCFAVERKNDGRHFTMGWGIEKKGVLGPTIIFWIHY
jgi:hypothetical protein